MCVDQVPGLALGVPRADQRDDRRRDRLGRPARAARQAARAGAQLASLCLLLPPTVCYCLLPCVAQVRSSPHNYVLNGVAYHPSSGRLYVTGKQWDHMYQLRIVPQPSLGPEHVLSHCGLGRVRSRGAGRRRG